MKETQFRFLILISLQMKGARNEFYLLCRIDEELWVREFRERYNTSFRNYQLLSRHSGAK